MGIATLTGVKNLKNPVVTIVALAFLITAAHAQEATPAVIPASAQPTDSGGAASNNAVPQPQSATSNDHMFDLIPNFLTLENAGKVPPLTSGGKFKAVARGAFDWGEFLWVAGITGVDQLENTEPEFHQGLEGYAKRYGANFADNTLENFMTSAIFASVLRQDPRFYQSSHGSFLHRLGYAASRILITRGDSGSAQFNFSEVFGSAVAAGISTYSYHPQSDRTVTNTASVWGTQIGYDTLSLVLKEFWPDIRKKVFHENHPAAH